MRSYGYLSSLPKSHTFKILRFVSSPTTKSHTHIGYYLACDDRGMVSPALQGCVEFGVRRHNIEVVYLYPDGKDRFPEPEIRAACVETLTTINISIG